LGEVVLTKIYLTILPKRVTLNDIEFYRTLSLR